MKLVAMAVLLAAISTAQILPITSRSSSGVVNNAFERGGSTTTTDGANTMNANDNNNIWDQGNTIRGHDNTAVIADGIGPNGLPASSSAGQQRDGLSQVSGN